MGTSLHISVINEHITPLLKTSISMKKESNVLRQMENLRRIQVDNFSN